MSERTSYMRFKTTLAVLRCPSCGKSQCPTIKGEKYECKHCGHSEHLSGWSGARKGISKYGSPEASKEAWKVMAREWKEAHPDEVRESKEKYRRSPRGRYMQRKWRYENKEHLKKAKHEWYESHKSEVLERSREWRRLNPDLHKQSKVKTILKAYGEMQQDFNDRRHGTITGYTYGCRCGRCKESARAYRRAKKNG